ncbi:hypothetical protein H4Q26_015770 [Puccinia striiformis f. sp. tritici PST-130]|nr:hypothetical protein H4Q26_015770 [Puccinia striiformis f. sp. tritici PST-130]
MAPSADKTGLEMCTFGVSSVASRQTEVWSVLRQSASIENGGLVLRGNRPSTRPGLPIPLQNQTIRHFVYSQQFLCQFKSITHQV